MVGKGERWDTSAIAREGGTAVPTILPTDKAHHRKTQQRLQRERDGLGKTGIDKRSSQRRGRKSSTGSRPGKDAEHSMMRIRGRNSEISKGSFGRNITVAEGHLVSPSLG